MGDFSGSPANVFATGSSYLNQPQGIALDSAGNLYVANAAGSPSVQVYPPNIGCAGPSTVLTGPNTLLQRPTDVALDPSGYLYVTNGPANLLLYAPLYNGTLNAAPLANVALPIARGSGSQSNQPALALDAAGRIYVTSELDNEVLVLPARSGNTLSGTPVATLAGPATLLDAPRGIALDPSGKIYVSNGSGPSGAGSVTVYAAQPSGTTASAPIAQIAGPNTRIVSPYGVATDRLGEIYVADAQNGLLEFAPNPSGVLNEAPAGAIPIGPLAGGRYVLYRPLGVAARPVQLPESKAIVFKPSWFYVNSSQYDYFGKLEYFAIPGAQPKPVPPWTGYLACNDGHNGNYSVDLQVSAGPYDKGVIEDRFVVLPQSVKPPKGTILQCTSAWGLYTSSGDLLSSTTLYATIAYNTGMPPILFEPGSVVLKSSDGDFTGTLAYEDTASGGVRPLPGSSGYLTCDNGASVRLQVASGPDVGGTVRDTYTIVPQSSSEPFGTTVNCSSVWGAYDSSGTLLGQATLQASIYYDR